MDGVGLQMGGGEVLGIAAGIIWKRGEMGEVGVDRGMGGVI